MENQTVVEDRVIQTLMDIKPEVMRRFHGKHEISLKSDDSLVTDSDKNIENILKESLGEIIPDSYFLGEENSDITPHEYRKIFDNEYIWAIDPIDGTANFANRNPFFAVSVGLLRKEKEGHRPIIGAVLFPALNELIYTRAGKSYSLMLDSMQKTEHQPQESESEKSIVMLTDSFYKKYEFNNQATTAQPRQVGCTVGNIVYTAIGRSIGTMTAAHLWDFAGSLAIAHNLGVQMRRYKDGIVKDTFGVEDFIISNPKKDWRMKEMYIISTDKNYSLMKQIMKEK